MNKTITTPACLEYLSPAKVNLFLYITGRRKDGFHELSSFFAKLSFGDRLTFIRMNDAPAPAYCPIGTPALPIRLETNHPDLPADNRNLIVQAAERLLPLVGERALAMPVSIKLEKMIPLGGGLGGGSSNAATALTALNRLWEAGQSRAELAALAAQIGSDVPFFLGASQALVSGRGEIVQPVKTPWPFDAVLILPPLECPTALVYQAFAAGSRQNLPRQLMTPEDFFRLDGTPRRPSEIAPQLINMLWPAAAAVQPALLEIAGCAEKLCSRPVLLSGSGSALFVLADSPHEAADHTQRLASLTAQIAVSSRRRAGFEFTLFGPIALT